MYNRVKSGHMIFNQSDFSIGIMCVTPWAAVCRCAGVWQTESLSQAVLAVYKSRMRVDVGR